jgi:hypothetical protein
MVCPLSRRARLSEAVARMAAIEFLAPVRVCGKPCLPLRRIQFIAARLSIRAGGHFHRPDGIAFFHQFPALRGHSNTATTQVLVERHRGRRARVLVVSFNNVSLQDFRGLLPRFVHVSSFECRHRSDQHAYGSLFVAAVCDRSGSHRSSACRS